MSDALLRNGTCWWRGRSVEKPPDHRGIQAKPPYAICPNMTRNRGNYVRGREGGEGKDKLELGNHEENDVVSQLGTQTV